MSFRIAPLLLCLAGTAAAEGLNRISIHYRYADGDFPAVIRDIGEFAAANPSWSREDSAFVAKHLGVVYAANPETRERGKYHLLRLLELDAEADLADMFVSEDIQGVFGDLRREHAARLREERERREAERIANRPFWRKPPFWAAAGVAAAGVTAVILLYPDVKPRPEYVVH